MPTLLLQYEATDARAEEVERVAQAAFAAVAAEAPAGIRWSYYRRAGSDEFVALLELDRSVGNPLLGTPAADELQATVARWTAGERPQPVEALGIHGAAD